MVCIKKLCDRLEELALSEKIWKEWFDPTRIQDDNIRKGYVRKDVYEMLFDKCEQLEKNANSKSVFKLEKEVSRLRSIIMRLYDEQNTVGNRYVFSNIPNDHYGKWFVQMMQIYLNNKSYTMKARGQYLDKTKLSDGETWRNYNDGQPLSKSRCIRVYLDKKKESA